MEKTINFRKFALLLIFFNAIFVCYWEGNVSNQFTVLLCVLVVVILINHAKLSINKRNYALLAIPLIFLLSAVLFNRTIGVIGFVTNMFLTIYIGALIKPDENDFIYIMKLARGFACVVTLGIFWEVIDPQFFIKRIIPIYDYFFPDNTIYNNLSSGHYFGFGIEAAITGCWIVYGFFATIALGRLHSNKLKLKEYIMLIAMIIAINFTGKRAHLLIPIMTLIFVPLITSKLTKWKVAYMFLWILLFVFLIIIYPFINLDRISNAAGALGKILLVLKSSEDMSMGIRYKLWEEAIVHFLGKPIWGTGFMTFHQYSLGNYDAHNVYLQLLAEVGCVGTILVIGVFTKKLKYWFSLLKMDSIITEQKAALYFCIYMTLFNMMYFMTGNSMYQSSFYSMMFLSLGYAGNSNLIGD